MVDHSLISREIVPKQIALDFFQTLAKCPEGQLSIAVDWIQEATVRLSLADCAKDLVTFAQSRGATITEPESTLEALFSLEGLRASLDWSGLTLVEYLATEAKREELIQSESDVARVTEVLNRFFQSSAKLERTRKAQKVYDGLLPNYESCSSLVEFRPVFNEGRQEIVNGIIAATLTLQMRLPKSGADLEKISVQLDATDIDELTTELTTLRTKIEALKSFASKQTVLLNPSRSLEGKNGK